MKQKTNGVMGRRALIKGIEEAMNKVETNRLNNTPERRAQFEQARAMEEYEKKLAEQRTQFKVGQLVWKKVVVDDGDLIGSGIIFDRCERILKIMPYSIETEMLYVTDGEGTKKVMRIAILSPLTEAISSHTTLIAWKNMLPRTAILGGKFSNHIFHS
jgi:hypothetical protein